MGGDWYPVTVAGVTRYFPAKKVLTHGDSKVFPAEMELYWRVSAVWECPCQLARPPRRSFLSFRKLGVRIIWWFVVCCVVRAQIIGPNIEIALRAQNNGGRFPFFAQLHFARFA